MDWKEARRQTDIYIVSTADGLRSTKQLTYTKEKNEASMGWLKDSTAFLFLSNRDAPESASGRNQLYLMRHDGGEARQITDAREGVADYALSDNGEWVVYRSGRSGEQQLHRLAVKDLDRPAEQLTKHPTGITTWQWGPDSGRIYFTAPTWQTPMRRPAARSGSPSTSRMLRRRPRASGHSTSTGKKTDRLTEDATYSVGDFRSLTMASGLASRAARRSATSATSPQAGLYGDLYLLTLATGASSG